MGFYEDMKKLGSSEGQAFSKELQERDKKNRAQSNAKKATTPVVQTTQTKADKKASDFYADYKSREAKKTAASKPILGVNAMAPDEAISRVSGVKKEAPKTTIQAKTYDDPETVYADPDAGFWGTTGAYAWHALKDWGRNMANTIGDTMVNNLQYGEYGQYDPTFVFAQDNGLMDKDFSDNYGKIVDKKEEAFVRGAKERAEQSERERQRIETKTSFMPEWEKDWARRIGQTANVAPTMATGIVLGPEAATLALGAQAYGGGMGEALVEGATIDQAREFGLASSVLETTIEKVAGGIPGLGDGALTNAATKMIKNQGTRRAVSYIVDAIGEGGEEVAATFFTPYLKRATYEPDAPLPDFEEYKEAFLGGVTGSIFLNGGQQIANRISPAGRLEAAGQKAQRADERAIRGIDSAYEQMKQNGIFGQRNQAGDSIRQATEAERRYAGKAIKAGALDADSYRNGRVTFGRDGEAESVRVGRATKIYQPYQGNVPTQVKAERGRQVIPEQFVKTAQETITAATNTETKEVSRSWVRRSFEQIFDAQGGQKQVAVQGVTMDGEPYVVSVGKRAVRKVVSDPHLSAEKLAVLEDIEKVIANGEYVGSGEYNQKGKKEKDTVRYDYFETPVSINGTDYIVTFDVEVFPNTNNYRTHKVINEMDLTPISVTDDAPVASAAEMALSPSINSISQNAENSNNNILGDGESFEKGQENTSSTVFDGPPSPQGEGFLNPSTADAVPLPLGKGGSRRGKLGSAKAVADILSSAYGVKFAEYSAEDGLNGYYDPQTRVIYVNQLSDEPVLATVSHELIHDLKVNDPGAFSLLRQIVNSDMNLEKFNQYKKELLAAYDAIGKDYSGMTEVELYEHVLEEAMADLCSEVMRDPSTITRIAKADRNLTQRIMDKLKEILETIQRAFSEYFGGETLEVRELVNNFVEVKAVYQSVLENSAKRGPQSEGTSGEVKSSIETLPDGKRYVQADRKVISGDDPKAWGEQVKSYINKEIRKGKNVVVYGIDGDPLTITADTSGKAKFRNIITEKDGTERPMTNRDYAVKLRAESHIDEVSQVSKRGKKDVPDEKNHPFAKDGFNYRTAYFMDEDGSYYRLTISVGKNGEVNTVYNVGKLKEAPFPLSGSKAGRNSVYGGTSNNSIPQSNGAVNTSIRSEQQKDTSFDKPMSVSRKGETEENFINKLLHRAAWRVKRASGSGTSIQDITVMLDDLFYALSENPEADKTEVLGICHDVADEIMNTVAPDVITDDYAVQVLRDIRNTKISLDETQKREARAIFGNRWRNRFMGRVVISDSGVPIESQWQEWAREYPSLFDETISDGDMIAELDDIISKMKEAKETPIPLSQEERAEKVADIANELYHQYLLYEEDIALREKNAANSRTHKAEAAISKFNETGDVRDLPERTWARSFRRDTENRSRYLANQMQDLEYQLEYADEESRKSIEGAIAVLRDKIKAASESAGIAVELNDVLDNATLNRNVELAPVIGELKDTDTGLKLKNGNYRFNDFYRNMERFFGKHFHLVKPLVDSFDSSKGDFARMQAERLAEMRQYIVKELGIKPGSKESKAVQWIGEKQRNPLTKEEVAEIDRIVEAQVKEKGLSKKQASELKKSLRVDYTESMLRNEFGDEKAERILKAERWFRQQYEELIDEINRTQRLIYPNRPDKQIPKRQDYMRHFREMETGFRGLRNVFDVDNNIDPSLVLVSDHTKPKEKWASIKQQREGNVTDEGAIEGFLDYLPQAAYAIHINPYIDKFRGLARDIAELKAETGDTSANGFVKYLNDFASHIAGKSSAFDRAVIDLLGSNGRKFAKSLAWSNNRVKINAVLANIGSVSKQVMNIPNGVELLHNPAGIFQGILDVVAGIAEGAGKTNPSTADAVPLPLGKGGNGKVRENYQKSDFLTERFLDKSFSKFEKNGLKKGVQWLLGAADEFGTRAIWNAAYREGVKLYEAGEITETPERYADVLTRRAVAGRGVGEVPLAYQSQIGKLVLPFQIEVSNSWNVKRDVLSGKAQSWGKKSTGLERASREAIGYLATFALGAAVEALTGSSGAFNPLDDILDGILQGWKEEEEGDLFDKIVKMGQRSTQNIAGDFIGNRAFGWVLGEFLSMIDEDWSKNLFNDRVFQSQGVNVPAVQSLVKGVKDFKDGDPVGGTVELATSFLTPFGGKQIDKTVRGVADFIHGGKYQNDIYKEWSTGERGDKRYDIPQTAGNFAKSFLFGPSALKEGQDYWDDKKLEGYAQTETANANTKAMKQFAKNYNKAHPDSEVEALYREVKDFSVYPFSPVKMVQDFERDHKKHTLRLLPAEQAQYQKEQDKRMQENYEAVFKTDAYRKADAEGKAELLEKARKEATETVTDMMQNDYLYKNNRAYSRLITEGDHIKRVYKEATDYSGWSKGSRTACLLSYASAAEKDGRMTQGGAKKLQEAMDREQTWTALDEELYRITSEGLETQLMYNAYDVFSFTKDKKDYCINVPAEDLADVWVDMEARFRTKLNQTIATASYQNATLKEKQEEISKAKTSVRKVMRDELKARYGYSIDDDFAKLARMK